MIEKLAELNRVLVAVTELATEKGADRQAVLDHCATVVIEGRIPDHERTLTFAEGLGLLQVAHENVRITESGDGFLQLNPEKLYDLSFDQRKLLIRQTYLHGKFRVDTLRLLRSFSPAFSEATFRWSETDSSPLEGPAWLVPQLEELGLLRRIPDGLEVAPDYVTTVAEFLAEGKGFSDDEFEAWLKEKREIGDLAERLVLAFERERLRKLGRRMESQCVRYIGRLRPNAGYDIDSYDDAMPQDLRHNRFIEIKGSRGAAVRFFWTENEMKAARDHGPKYWIYFQGGIDLKTGAAKNKPLLFQNPAETILKGGQFEVTPHGVLVTAGLRGDAIATTP